MLSALVLAGVALLPATAPAAIIVGSDLSLPASSTANPCIIATPPCTALLFGVHPGNQFPAKSPTKGTVLSFGIKSGGGSRVGDTVTFRLGRLSTAFPTTGTGAGTGPTATLLGAGTYAIPANVPVKAGDYLALDSSSIAADSYPVGCFTGASYLVFHPVLTDGGPFQSVNSNSTCELLVNAVIQPSSFLAFGKQKYKLNKGIVILPVEVPGPGELFLSGKGVVKLPARSTGATVSRTVTEAGTVKLKIKPKGKAKKKLAATGKAKVKVSIRFAPIGGDPSTQKRKIKLKKRI